ncbi:hypothetical protein SO802_004401 [Lithocarpus litseifolius]|uniref:Uncharacterized protein n=1 Tax=Lithocarpus litseifolius TaxID=425828 RepID=A0AAW2E2U8_9ROSI
MGSIDDCAPAIVGCGWLWSGLDLVGVGLDLIYRCEGGGQAAPWKKMMTGREVVFVSCVFWFNVIGLLVAAMVKASFLSFLFSAVVGGGEWMWWLWVDVDVDVEARDALLLDMEPWKNWDLSESRVMEKHFTEMIMHGTQIGNGWIDDSIGQMGTYDYFWTHALNSDKTNTGIHKYCNFATSNFSSTCHDYLTQGNIEAGALDISNICAPVCNLSSPKSGPSGSVHDFDACSNHYVDVYLNLAEVQTALHTKATKWEACRNTPWTDSPTTVLPTINQIISSGISVWIYSGDMDGLVSVTTSRYSINTLNLPVSSTWRPWYSGNEVGGYVVGYKGLTFTTVRGAGHMVPSYQPERALIMISSFLKGKLPPSE